MAVCASNLLRLLQEARLLAQALVQAGYPYRRQAGAHCLAQRSDNHQVTPKPAL